MLTRPHQREESETTYYCKKSQNVKTGRISLKIPLGMKNTMDSNNTCEGCTHARYGMTKKHLRLEGRSKCRKIVKT